MVVAFLDQPDLIASDAIIFCDRGVVGGEDNLGFERVAFGRAKHTGNVAEDERVQVRSEFVDDKRVAVVERVHDRAYELKQCAGACRFVVEIQAGLCPRFVLAIGMDFQCIYPL